MHLRVLLLCLLVALLVSVPATAAPDGPSPGLPLGEPGLKETRSTQQIAPGVTYTRIVRGKQSKDGFYTVDVAFKAARAAAEEAVNLDGGSTTMTLGTQLVTRPSDATGKRPIGDAVVVLP